MTTDQMIDCLDGQQVRDILKAVAASVTANQNGDHVGDILHDWSIIEHPRYRDTPATTERSDCDAPPQA